MDYILFDLDGTLTDSGLGITNSVRHALEKAGQPVPSQSVLESYIGPPLFESFMEISYLTAEQAAQAVIDYRETYQVTGIFENVLYDGIKEVLAELADAGKKIILATSKPEPYARQILDHFGITAYFDGIFGASMDGKLVDKADIIALAIAANAPDLTLDNAVMVGDRFYDIAGAKKNKLPSIGVTYGFGNKEELTSAGADFIAATPSEILAYI